MADMVRTNIYLTEHHQTSFAKLAKQTGLTASEHIRRAADAYLKMHPPGKAHLIDPPIPILDADGYVHATLIDIQEDWQSCGDHDVRRLEWIFRAPTANNQTYHFFWTGGRLIHSLREEEWEGKIVQDIDGLFRDLEDYSLFTYVLLKLRVLTPADLVTHTYDPHGIRQPNEDVIQRLDAFRTTFNVTSLVGTRCRYRLGLVRDLFFWREDSEEWPWPALEMSSVMEGPDIYTLELDEPETGKDALDA